MRTFGRFLGRTIIFVAVLAAAMWVWGPYEQISLKPAFVPATIGADIDGYLAAQEARFDDITPGVEKRVLWRDAPGARADLAVVYIHGFSATSEEIRPVPDRVAEALGANLVFTRLQGHGRDGAALDTATVQGWADDLAEAMEIARRIGDDVVIVATSTGASLVAAMLDQPDVMAGLKGLVMISPNFAINNPMAPLLTLPAARLWVPVIGGRTRSWTPQNDAHGRYWTTSYPTTAVFQMAALVEQARNTDYADVQVPTLVWFSDADSVVSAAATREVMARWGRAPVLAAQEPRDGMDPGAHVIAGDILSPGETDRVLGGIMKFINGL